MENLTLSTAQQRALEEIQEECAYDYRDNPKVIVVQGFSGAGKSALVDSIKDELQQDGHLVLDPEFLQHAESAVEYVGHEGQIIVAAGFYHAREIRGSLYKIANPAECGYYHDNWDHVLKREAHAVDLEGMDADEMRAYAAARDSKSLDVDGIVECSVGLPGLADELMDIPHLDLGLARRLSALHLWSNIGGELNRGEYLEGFLNIEPSSEIKKLFDKGFYNAHLSKERHIYDRLPSLHSNHWWSSVPEDVTFVAPESIDVYTESLGKTFTGISIYMPRLSGEEFDAVARLMGYVNGEFDGKTPRWYLFGVNQKELYSYGRIGEKDFGMVQWEPLEGYDKRGWRVSVAALNKAIDTGVVPFPEASREGEFKVTVNDHGGVNHQPINLGWMLESFLQQKGIPYLAHNGMCGKSYVFNPTTQRLDFLERSISGKIRSLEKDVEKEMPHEF